MQRSSARRRPAFGTASAWLNGVDQKPAQISERLGWLSGWMIAPLFAVVSFARAARTFHPRGPTFHASVRADAAAPVEWHAFAKSLVGPALVRFSGALWKRAQRIPDVLGCAIRLRRVDTDDPEPSSGDQDLLFATIRRPWTLFFAPATTRVTDYLQNDYYGVSPFDFGTDSRMYLRLCPQRPHDGRGKRSERLEAALEQGVWLKLECSPKPFGPYAPLATIHLERPADIADDDLHFSPFRTGRNVRPRGFVHALRRGVYEASQRARDARR